jgi:hypothetical protein
MNTGSPHVLHTRRWERFGRTINHLVDDFDVFTADAATEESAPQHAAVERRLKASDRKEVT